MEVPSPGFYYHFRHNPEGAIYNCAYEVLNISRHSEDDCKLIDKELVIYRPLYPTASTYINVRGPLWCARPLSMWCEHVTLDSGVTVPRFARITDKAIVEQLIWQCLEMYGEVPLFLLRGVSWTN